MLQPYKGRCWKLPDDVSSDQLIAAQHVFDFDPQLLRKHLLAELRPELSRQAQPGDILLAGENFANGSNHSHPFLAMKAIGMGLICCSVPRGPYRLAVFMGIPLLTCDAEIYRDIADGDRIEVDFASGELIDRSRDRHHRLQPLPPFLIDIVSAGGGLEYAALQNSGQAASR
jgi:3-isopropylmalate/(R)-2-methylmalate dehydratase small subunit